MDFVLSYVIFIMLNDISSWLVQSIVESIIIMIVRESGLSYVHWDWGIIVLSRCIR
jgi:hypothetical protein